MQSEKERYCRIVAKVLFLSFNRKIPKRNESYCRVWPVWDSELYSWVLCRNERSSSSSCNNGLYYGLDIHDTNKCYKYHNAVGRLGSNIIVDRMAPALTHLLITLIEL